MSRLDSGDSATPKPLEVDSCPCCGDKYPSYRPADQEYHCEDCGASWIMTEDGEAA